MTEELRVAVDRKPNGAVLYTKGYINNVGGEEIANRAYELMDAGVRTLLLNLRETKIVNSIGISILIEIIEKMIDKGGKIAFCCLTPVIHKTFQIMGLANYATIFDNEEAAMKELGTRRGSCAQAHHRATAILRPLACPPLVHQFAEFLHDLQQLERAALPSHGSLILDAFTEHTPFDVGAALSARCATARRCGSPRSR